MSAAPRVPSCRALLPLALLLALGSCAAAPDDPTRAACLAKLPHGAPEVVLRDVHVMIADWDDPDIGRSLAITGCLAAHGPAALGSLSVKVRLGTDNGAPDTVFGHTITRLAPAAGAWPREPRLLAILSDQQGHLPAAIFGHLRRTARAELTYKACARPDMDPASCETRTLVQTDVPVTLDCREGGACQ